MQLQLLQTAESRHFCVLQKKTRWAPRPTQPPMRNSVLPTGSVVGGWAKHSPPSRAKVKN